MAIKLLLNEIEGEKTHFDSDEFTDEIPETQLNILEQLIKNAKKSNIWVKNSRGPVYNGTAPSTLHNKKAYWKKVVSDSMKITEMFQVIESDTDYIFEDIYDSDNDNKFNLKSLDILLKKKKFLTSNSQLIHSLTNQWLNNGVIITSKRDHYAKIRSLFLHKDLKLRVIEYLHAYKFKLKIGDFVKFIESEVISILGIEKKPVSHTPPYVNNCTYLVGNIKTTQKIFILIVTNVKT
ncbi:hypothetical protein Glove_329g39 [Diversispora epigaea]|uniref:Uncharacterized protein n=1 Tax=Diversispora epigaea TaxID=1348612 RepID=A0A397HNE1_9GLOM|nr:hypothetical protein Glove_329g39 [Diversispora epigaea]